jgi:hypothetical protein
VTARSNPWIDPEFAGTYAKESADPVTGWYENKVNAPSIVGLIPRQHLTRPNEFVMPKRINLRFQLTGGHLHG